MMDLETKLWGALTVLGLVILIGFAWAPGIVIFSIGGIGLVVRGSYDPSL